MKKDTGDIIGYSKMTSFERMKLKSPWKELDSEFATTLILLDVIINNLTLAQSIISK
jgi:hypothetical protein